MNSEFPLYDLIMGYPLIIILMVSYVIYQTLKMCDCFPRANRKH